MCCKIRLYHGGQIGIIEYKKNGTLYGTLKDNLVYLHIIIKIIGYGKYFICYAP